MRTHAFLGAHVANLEFVEIAEVEQNSCTMHFQPSSHAHTSAVPQLARYGLGFSP